MWPFSRLRSWLGRPSEPEKRKGSGSSAFVDPTAKYDAAQTSPDNRRHWLSADGLSANAANSVDVRRVLRNRARYEDDNNPHVHGLTGDRASDAIGTGPRLQLTIPETVQDADFQRELPVPNASELARAVETRWSEWCAAVGLNEKLATIVETWTRDGEIFALRFMNEALEDTVKLDIRLYETDQIDTPDFDGSQPNAVPGIVFDQFGNPSEYHVLRRHPGEQISFATVGFNDFDAIPARQMIHLYKPRRPGQARGVPEFTSALPAYAILRRFTLASLLTAEQQARINAVITSELSSAPDPDEEDATTADAGGEQIQFAGTHALVLSGGQDAHTLPSTAPAPNYVEFKTDTVADSGRAIGAPRHIATASAHQHTYATGRLEQQQWQHKSKVLRGWIERKVLNILFREWLRAAKAAINFLPAELPDVAVWRWKWRWDGFVSIDPVKDAAAATERLNNHTSSLDRECADLGDDWEDVQDQRLIEELREMRRREKLGLPPAAQTAKPAPIQQPQPDPSLDQKPGDPNAD